MMPPNAPQIHVRAALTQDIEHLGGVEAACFEAKRQSSRKSLTRSLQSPHQRVGLAVLVSDQGQDTVAGAAIFFVYPKSIRLYSIATLPAFQRCGVGKALLEWATDEARSMGKHKLSLEADANNLALIAWYKRQAFAVETTLPNYYGPGEDGVRMVRHFHTYPNSPRVALITETPSLWSYQLPNVIAITPIDYLNDPQWQKSETLRVINICNDHSDQSLGYYASLLAAARNHRIMPDVIAIKDWVSHSTRKRLSERYTDAINEALEAIDGDEFELPVIFERATNPKNDDLAKRLSRSLGSPLLKVRFRKDTSDSAPATWHIQSVRALSLRETVKKYQTTLDRAVPTFFAKRRFQNIELPSYRYDLAILVNPEEENPPSDPEALQRLQKAAERKGFYVEQITAKDRKRINEFDALLIRETTAVNHHTYRIAREAVTEGLVVIDDPWSILRCANKIFLYERLTRARILQPKAWLFYVNKDWRLSYPNLPFPLVIKRPEGCFSKGVFRVENAKELDQLLATLFKEMDVVIGQEFLPSDFDWRIGILNNKPLFACQYFMATGHWQVCNWASEDGGEDGFHLFGDSKCIPIPEVPTAVIQTAKRAAACIGDGLYGVDLKESNGRVYVIEVNDNPNIEVGIEDIIEGYSLYERVAEDLARRIEEKRETAASVKAR